MLKTKHEVDMLKAKWLHNPTFKLENEPGFREHYLELKKFREDTERDWAICDRIDAQRKHDIIWGTPGDGVFTGFS